MATVKLQSGSFLRIHVNHMQLDVCCPEVLIAVAVKENENDNLGTSFIICFGIFIT